MTDYKVVNSRSKEIFTDANLHPGEILQMELAARNIKKTEFAESLGMKPGHFIRGTILATMLLNKYYVSKE